MTTEAVAVRIRPARAEIVALGLDDARRAEIRAIEAEISDYVSGAVGLGLTDEEMLDDVLHRYGHHFCRTADIDVVRQGSSTIVRFFVRLRTDA